MAYGRIKPLIIIIVAFVFFTVIIQAEDAIESNDDGQDLESTISELQSSCDRPIGDLEGNYSKKIDASTWNKYGNTEAKYGYYDSSLRFYNIAVLKNPNFIDSWNNKGIALFHLGCIKDSIGFFDKAIQINRDNEVPWYNKGLAFYHMGLNEEALNFSKRAAEINPKNAIAWNCMGNALSNLNNYEAALNCYNSSINANLYYSKAWNNKGIALSKVDSYYEALKCFENAARLSPNSTDIEVNYGLVFRAMGQDAKAEFAFAEAKTRGYNGTIADYSLQSDEFIFMDSSNSALPSVGVLTAIGLLLSARILSGKGASSLARRKAR